MPARFSIRTRLTLWYVTVLAILLLVYAGIVFAFQYATLTSQIFHDEVQDVETVEGLLYFDGSGHLQLRQDYYSRPQSHLLVDRLMEVRDPSGLTLYRSPTLHDLSLGGPSRPGEGDSSFNEEIVRLADGQHVFVISHVHAMNGHVLLIRLGYSLSALRQRMEQFLFTLLIALPLTLALAAFAGQMIARRALRPLEQMAANAEGISASNLHDRLTTANTHDELGQLATVFNVLLQRLEEAFQQLQRFTADAAHELRTPLAAIRAVGEVTLEAKSTPEAYQEAIAGILEESSRLNGTIDSLLLLAKAEATAPASVAECFAIGPLVDEVLAVLSILAEEKRLILEQFGSEYGTIEVCADRALLRIAILNVIHNAIKFSPTAGKLQVGFTPLMNSTGGVELIVQDDGPGLNTEDLRRAFDRFYRGATHLPGNQVGTGLGLSIAKLVLQRAGGDVRFDAAPSSGARCILTLPASGQTSSDWRNQ